jgi:hypothetical protein
VTSTLGKSSTFLSLLMSQLTGLIDVRRHSRIGPIAKMQQRRRS